MGVVALFLFCSYFFGVYYVCFFRCLFSFCLSFWCSPFGCPVVAFSCRFGSFFWGLSVACSFVWSFVFWCCRGGWVSLFCRCFCLRVFLVWFCWLSLCCSWVFLWCVGCVCSCRCSPFSFFVASRGLASVRFLGRWLVLASFFSVGGRFWWSPLGIFWRWSRWCRSSAPCFRGGIACSRSACFRFIAFGRGRPIVSPALFSSAPLFVRVALLSWWGLFAFVRWIIRFPLFWSSFVLVVFSWVS